MSRSSIPPIAAHFGRGLSGAAPCLVAAALAGGCTDGAVPDGGAAAAAAKAAKLPPARVVSFVKLEALSELNGQPWTSIAELTLIDSTRAAVDRAAWKAAADSAAPHDQPANAIDGNPGTLWHTPWDGDIPPQPPHALTIQLGAPVKLSGFSYLPRQDKIRNGTIAKYRFFVSSNGVDWGEPVSAGDFGSMGPPTLEKTVFFAAQTENHAPVVTAPPAQSSVLGQTVSLQISASDADADTLSYQASGLPSGLALASKTGVVFGTPIAPGSHEVKLSVADHKGLAGTASFQWTVQAPATASGSAALAAGEARFVKLEEVTEVNGKPWAAVAEFNLVGPDGKNLPRTGWQASADSADANDRPHHAIDGNPGSLWHSQWDGASPPPPHSLIVDLGGAVTVRGFRYLPRQDKLTNGMLAKFRFYASADGVNWGAPLAEGDFSASGGVPQAEKTVLLK